MDRLTLQTLTTKLDLGQITLKEAKQHVWHNYQWDIGGRTKEQFLKNCFVIVKRNENDATDLQSVV